MNSIDHSQGFSEYVRSARPLRSLNTAKTGQCKREFVAARQFMNIQSLSGKQESFDSVHISILVSSIQELFRNIAMR